MTHPKRRPDSDLMRLVARAIDGRLCEVPDGAHPFGNRGLDGGGDPSTDSNLLHCVNEMEPTNTGEARAAILESLAYDGVEVEAWPFWPMLQIGYVVPFARKGT